MTYGLLAIRLGKRRWVQTDLVPVLAETFELSKSEVKRIIKQSGLHVEWIDKRGKDEE